MPETAVEETIRDALVRATGMLAQTGCESPRLDAELLLAEVLQVDRSRLVLDADAPLDVAEAERFAGCLARRARREPVAYILGRREFRHVTLGVDPRVLIPRPETELLVEVGLGVPAGARVLDVGTGSGAIALALKDERPDLEVWGTDVSDEALAVARANSERLQLEVHWLQADLLAGVPGPFDAVLSNPPYVAGEMILQPEVERFEPALALRAGRDGLEVIRRLISQAAPDLPLLALEVGFDQGAAVSGLLCEAGFRAVEVMRDLAGHERVVVGRR